MKQRLIVALLRLEAAAVTAPVHLLKSVLQRFHKEEERCGTTSVCARIGIACCMPLQATSMRRVDGTIGGVVAQRPGVALGASEDDVAPVPVAHPVASTRRAVAGEMLLLSIACREHMLHSGLCPLVCYQGVAAVCKDGCAGRRHTLEQLQCTRRAWQLSSRRPPVESTATKAREHQWRLMLSSGEAEQPMLLHASRIRQHDGTSRLGFCPPR